MEAHRLDMAALMVGIDVINCLVIFYVAITITRQFGFGNSKARLQYAHRVALIGLGIVFGWHAEDVAMHPETHGLSMINLIEHVVVLIAFSIGAVRIALGRKQIVHLNAAIKARNGDILSGLHGS